MRHNIKNFCKDRLFAGDSSQKDEQTIQSIRDTIRLAGEFGVSLEEICERTSIERRTARFLLADLLLEEIDCVGDHYFLSGDE